MLWADLVDLRGQEAAKNLIFNMNPFDHGITNGSIKNNPTSIPKGTTFRFDPNRVDYTLPVGEVVGIDLFQVDQHPFHIHINPFQLTSGSGESGSGESGSGSGSGEPSSGSGESGSGSGSGEPSHAEQWEIDWFQSGDWHDTLFNPDSGTQRVLMQTDFFTGATVVHCHILMHEDDGMMVQVNFTGVEGSRYKPAYGDNETCRVAGTCNTSLIDRKCYSSSKKVEYPTITTPSTCPPASPTPSPSPPPPLCGGLGPCVCPYDPITGDSFPSVVPLTANCCPGPVVGECGYGQRAECCVIPSPPQPPPTPPPLPMLPSLSPPPVCGGRGACNCPRGVASVVPLTANCCSGQSGDPYDGGECLIGRYDECCVFPPPPPPPSLPPPPPSPPEPASPPSPLALQEPTEYSCPETVRKTNGTSGNCTCMSGTCTLSVVLSFGGASIIYVNSGLKLKDQAVDQFDMLGFNGKSPGPTLRVRAGDTLRILLKNNLTPELVSTKLVPNNNYREFDVVNLHTHGLHVSPRAPGDDVVKTAVAAHGENQYEYHIPEDHMGGTHWYHAHWHGAVSIHVNFGGAGMIIVEDAENQLPDELVDVLHGGTVEDYIIAAYHVDFYQINNITEKYITNCKELHNGTQSCTGIENCDGKVGKECQECADPKCVTQAQRFVADVPGNGPDVKLFLVNGQHEPTLEITADTWVRLRLGFMATGMTL